jgi:L-ascorbate metabolism protein UlaG (beta-lactamase superfamily)
MAEKVILHVGLRHRFRRMSFGVGEILRHARLLVAASTLFSGCAARAAQTSDHFDGRRFHNRAGVPEPTVREEAKVGWEMRTKKKNWPDRFATKRTEVPKAPVLHGFRVLWFGHAGALIQTPGLNIVTDPVLFDSIGPRPFSIRTVTDPGVAIDSLPRIDVILISHNHYDHLDLRSLHALLDRQRGDPPKVLVGLGVGALLKKEHVPSYSEMDWGDSVTVKDTKIFFLEAVHTSRRGTSDTNETLWGSFLIDSPEGRIYFAGDTAYGKHFKDVFEKYGAPKLSLLPIGAYEPRWFMYRMHMNPGEAVRAHLDLHSQHSVAIHFGLIDNAGESYEAPATDLAAARKANGIDQSTFVTPTVGQILQY